MRMRMTTSPSTTLLLLALQLAQLAQAGHLQLQAPSPRAHPCARPCLPGRPMTCRYDFHVENYHSMSKACYGCPFNATDCARADCIAGDGKSRALVSVNRQMPGPSLQVCLGDRLEVTVMNLMPEQSTTVHWHGMQQRGTPYMDGVPFVTQCPIQPHSSFRYSFYADTPGSHFWHSHTGCQRADGAVGVLTVRVPKAQDPHGALYDKDLPEHSILAWDWTHTPAASKFLAHHHAGDDNKADNVLINGKGVFRPFEAPDGTVKYTPREVFTVKQGLRYRFRLVNAGFLNCPLELSVDNHTLLVIASDGADVKPTRVDSLVSYAGERWDVVVEASQPVDNYWMRIHGLLDCGPKRAHATAILRYEGADPALDPDGPAPNFDVFTGTKGHQVNSLNKGSLDPDTTTAAELQALDGILESDPALRPEADVKLFVSYDFYALDNPHIHRAGVYGINQVSPMPHRVFTPQLNHISLSLPAFPLLSGRDRLDRSHALCNETSLRQEGRDCKREYCECTHIVRVPLDGVLEIILVDKGVRYDANHPFHLHGHAFRVVALEKLGTSTTVDEVQRMDAEGRLVRNLHNPPSKDTVTVPDGGYTVLRVHANNPGYWLFHCHIEFHVELGMSLVVKVGEDEDMAPVPKGFPQCGDWGSNSWLGDEDKRTDDIDVDVDVDVSDKLASGNHIARVLDTIDPQASSKGRIPSAASTTSAPPSPTPSSSTEASTATDDTSTENDIVDSTTTTEDSVRDTTTELLLLQTEEGIMVTDEFNYDATTKIAESDNEDHDEEDHTLLPGGNEPTATPSVTPGTTITPSTSAPAVVRIVSDFIMRVPSSRSLSRSSSSSGRTTEDSASKKSWVLVDPARPDLRYNVLVMDDPDVPLSAALAGSASLRPSMAVASAVLCLLLALPALP